MNETIRLLDARCSTRAYDPAPLTGEEKRAVLHAAMRAPTAGNLMLYSIIEIEDQALKDRLAVTCDDQPFIARAPWVLLFVADFQKWMDLFAACGCDQLPGVPHGVTPGLGDLLMACNDALIAAQNAVVAAESLGIGSCYIGDIMELGETHAELLQLPRYTFPVAMLCFGRPKVTPRRTERYENHVVHKNGTAGSPRPSWPKPHASWTSCTESASRGRGSAGASRTSTRASSRPATPPR